MLFPAELRRYGYLVVGSSLLLFAASLAAITVAFIENAQGRSSLPYAAFAAVAIPIAALGLILAPRWYRRAAYVISNFPALQAEVRFTQTKDSDSSTFYATVLVIERAIIPALSVAIVRPVWEVQQLTGLTQSVQLHVDRSTSRLMAISTPHGVVWCLPNNHAITFPNAV